MCIRDSKDCFHLPPYIFELTGEAIRRGLVGAGSILPIVLRAYYAYSGTDVDYDPTHSPVLTQICRPTPACGTDVRYVRTG
eukprot:3637324-Rhodomonas_salina.1